MPCCKCCCEKYPGAECCGPEGSKVCCKPPDECCGTGESQVCCPDPQECCVTYAIGQGESEVCCGPTQYCCTPGKGICCEVGDTCCEGNEASVCCTPEQECCNGICCEPGETCCGSEVNPVCCPEGVACVDGVCEECESDEDCPEGECCNQGVCEECECSEDSDCAAGYLCCNGECLPFNGDYAGCVPNNLCSWQVVWPLYPAGTWTWVLENNCSEECDCRDGPNGPLLINEDLSYHESLPGFSDVYSIPGTCTVPFCPDDPP